MPLYKVSMNFQVVVEAPSPYEALDAGIESFRTNEGVPAIGSSTLIERHSQIPPFWRDRRPANLPKGTPVCAKIIPPGRSSKKTK